MTEKVQVTQYFDFSNDLTNSIFLIMFALSVSCVQLKYDTEGEEPWKKEELKKRELEICILCFTAWACPFIHKHEKCLIIHMGLIQERTTDIQGIP